VSQEVTMHLKLLTKAPSTRLSLAIINDRACKKARYLSAHSKTLLIDLLSPGISKSKLTTKINAQGPRSSDLRSKNRQARRSECFLFLITIRKNS